MLGDRVQLDWFATMFNQFPFKSEELSQQARKILGDDLIKKAFSTKPL